MPAHAAWFDYTSIHDLEQKALPEFFSGQAASKTPKVRVEGYFKAMQMYSNDRSSSGAGVMWTRPMLTKRWRRHCMEMANASPASKAGCN